MKKYIIILLGVLVLGACNNTDNNKKLIITNITGDLNDVLVVMDSTLWKQSSGIVLKNILHYPVMGLPEYEPSFKAIHILKKDFSNIFQLYRNIIYVDIQLHHKKSSIWYGKDVYAKTQKFIKIKAKNTIELASLLKDNATKIRDYFHQAEIERLQQSYKNRISANIVKRLKKKFNIRINVPANYKLYTDTTDFVWISFETPTMTQSILVYSRPYVDTLQWKEKSLIYYRDFICKRFVQGPKKDAYMTTEKDFPVTYTYGLDTAGHYYAMIKALWKVENDFMGGPFVSYTVLDKTQTQLITVEGFVYNPKKDKHNYMTQLEAIIRTIRNK